MTSVRSRVRRMDRIASSSSRRPAGSRSLVGSSRIRTLGSSARTEASARRCFCPPERAAGALWREVREAHHAQARIHPPRDLCRMHPQVLGAEGHLEGDVGGEELGLEILEDEPDAVGEIPRALRADILAVDQDAAREVAADEVGNGAVQRGGQRRAAGTAPAEQPHQFAAPDVAGDVAKSRVLGGPVTERDVLETDHARCARSAVMPAGTRSRRR